MAKKSVIPVVAKRRAGIHNSLIYMDSRFRGYDGELGNWRDSNSLAAFFSNLLVRSLAATFERATTRKPIIYRNAVTSSYEGAFLVLVDAVLLRLLQLARELGYPPIAQPVTAEARGLFIVLTLRWTKTPTPAEN
jgi:hypothetical protein